MKLILPKNVWYLLNYVVEKKHLMPFVIRLLAIRMFYSSFTVEERNSDIHCEGCDPGNISYRPDRNFLSFSGRDDRKPQGNV